MEREVYDQLLKWKNSPYRKPLVLNGARQVGKTWILKEFGRREYKNTVYINCDNNPTVSGLFSDFDTKRILRVMTAISGERIEKGNTLIILDEIQEIPLGLTSLKYFAENDPEYHIAVAGSLLGISVHQGSGFPVGKVDEIRIDPLSFREFLWAMDKRPLLETIQEESWDSLQALEEPCKELLRQYYFTGGMPEVVNYYVQTQDILGVRNLQQQILREYQRDFSKHIPPVLLTKVNMVWNSIPSQLAKENKKYIYGAIKKGGRAKEFEDAIEWLVDAGLVTRVNRVSKVDKPLKFYEDRNAFKLFLHDLGLLGAMADVPPQDVLMGEKAFTEYKGAFTEQYVEQQLIANGITPYYYSNDNSTLEIDFVVQMGQVFPIEVKAEENLRSKSLRTVVSSREDLTGWRFSMSGYREQEWMINIPLYFAGEWISRMYKN